MALPPTVRRASADRVRPDVRTTRRAGKIRPIVETPMKPLTPAHKNTVTLTAACLACLMFGLEISSVPVILPILETVLRSSFRDLQWIMNAYTIACAAVLMAAGALADRYGRKRAFLLCLVLFGLTSLACGLAGSSTWLIAGRFLQGMAGGAMLVCQLAVLSHQFADSAARAKTFGAWGVVFGIGLGLGPIIGAGIVALSSWQRVFLVHVPIAVAAFGLAAAGVDESRDPQHRRLDWAGIVSLSVAVFGLAWFITQGPVAGFASLPSLASLLAAAGGFIIFAAAQRRAVDPLFDFSVFRIRRFSGALLGSMGMNFSFWPLMIYLPLYFQHGLGYASLATGLSLLAYTLPTLILPPLGERLALRYRAEAVIPAGLFAIGAGCFLMAWGSGVQQASWLTMLPGCLLASIGLGVTNTPVTNTTTGSVPTARRHGVRHRHQRALHQPGAEHRRDGLHPGGRHRLVPAQAAPTGDRCRPAPLAGRTADHGNGPDDRTGRGRVDRSRRNGQASAGPRFRLGDAVWRGQRLAVRAGQLAGVRRATRGAPDRRGSSVQ